MTNIIGNGAAITAVPKSKRPFDPDRGTGFNQVEEA